MISVYAYILNLSRPIAMNSAINIELYYSINSYYFVNRNNYPPSSPPIGGEEGGGYFDGIYTT